jgi:hypothetical protein
VGVAVRASCSYHDLAEVQRTTAFFRVLDQGEPVSATLAFKSEVPFTPRELGQNLAADEHGSCHRFLQRSGWNGKVM